MYLSCPCSSVSLTGHSPQHCAQHVLWPGPPCQIWPVEILRSLHPCRKGIAHLVVKHKQRQGTYWVCVKTKHKKTWNGESFKVPLPDRTMTLILRRTESNVSTSSSSNLQPRWAVSKRKIIRTGGKQIGSFWRNISLYYLSISSSLFKISMWLSFSLK